MKEIHPWIRWLSKMGIHPRSWKMNGFQQAAYIRSMIKDTKNRVSLDTPLTDIRYVVFDLETTGFRPWHGDEILSIGSVPVECMKVIKEEIFHSLVRPKGTIPQTVEALTGISWEKVKDQPSIETVLKEWLFRIRGVTLVAYGAKHDLNFLHSTMSRCFGLKVHHRVIDLYQIIRWLHPNWSNYSLNYVLEFYDIPIQGRHTALGDAMMTADLWVKVLHLLIEKKIDRLKDLYCVLGGG